MNGKYILDTSIVIKLFAKDKDVMKNIEDSSEIYLPVIVIGELVYGAYNSTKINENIDRIKELIDVCNILECDVETSFEYGRIKKELKNKGAPIPENDIWIAATSLRYNIPLAARDKHFTYIDAISYLEW